MLSEIRIRNYSLIDDLTEQLERTRSLLQGDSEAAAESALARLGGDQATEAVIADKPEKKAPAMPGGGMGGMGDMDF